MVKSPDARPLSFSHSQEHDEQVLSHLTDIKVIYQDDTGLVSVAGGEGG